MQSFQRLKSIFFKRIVEYFPNDHIFSLKPNQVNKNTWNVEDTNFFEKIEKKHWVLYYVSFLYPAGYANSMWILETLKLQTV